MVEGRRRLGRRNDRNVREGSGVSSARDPAFHGLRIYIGVEDFFYNFCFTCNESIEQFDYYRSVSSECLELSSLLCMSSPK